MTRLERGLTGLGIAVLAGAIIWLVYRVPLWLAHDTNRADTFRGQLVQLLSVAIAAAVAIYGIKKHYLDKDKQYTDSFSTAIEHLSAEDPFLRAGGARELERIMQYTPGDHTRVLETYADFLRHYAGPDSRPDPDQPPTAGTAAVIAAIRRRTPSRNEPPLDLRGVCLPHADLANAGLAHSNLAGADLTRADLRGADLTGADLSGATLVKADLTGAELARANLTEARLIDANLAHADLTGTNLTGAALRGANLRGTDLRHTTGSTPEQLTHAHTDSHA